jgi:hypothetical protein
MKTFAILVLFVCWQVAGFASPVTFANGTDVKQSYSVYTYSGWNGSGAVAVLIHLAPGAYQTIELKHDPAGNYHIYIPGLANNDIDIWPSGHANEGHDFIGLQGSGGSYSYYRTKLPAANTSMTGGWGASGSAVPLELGHIVALGIVGIALLSLILAKLYSK